MSTGRGGIKTAHSRTLLWQGLNSLVAGSWGGLGVLEGLAGAVVKGKGDNLGRPPGQMLLIDEHGSIFIFYQPVQLIVSCDCQPWALAGVGMGGVAVPQGLRFRAWGLGAKPRSLPDLEPAHDALLFAGAILVIPRLAPKQVEGVQPVLEVVEIGLELPGVHLSQAKPLGGHGLSTGLPLVPFVTCPRV